MANSQSAPKGALITALVLFCLGLAACGYAAARTVPFIRDVADFITELDDFAQNTPLGEPATFTAAGETGVVLVTGEAACTGEGPDGAVRFDPYESFGPSAEFELNGAPMSGYLLFDTRTGGEYTIVCGSGGSGSYLVTTAPTFLIDGAPGLVGGIFAGLGGALLVLVSIVVLIVGLVQRSRWRKRQGEAAAYGQPVPPTYGQSTPPPPGGVSGWGSLPDTGGGPAAPPPGTGTSPPGTGEVPPPPPSTPPPSAPPYTPPSAPPPPPGGEPDTGDGGEVPPPPPPPPR